MIPTVMAAAPAALPWWSALPFVGLLVCVAVLPLIAEHWWHSNFHKALVSLAIGLPVAAFIALRDPHALIHAALEYTAFISLLGALYVISGNVCIRGRLPSAPAFNTLLLAVGAVATNLVGTTGAAMLLIRPFLKANDHRSSRIHLVVFFILIVANCGGCLTPLGDPPLFLGFLKGVPFQWTLNLWKEWLLVMGVLLVVFYAFDRRRFEPAPPSQEPGLKVLGGVNLLLLGGVIAAVLASGLWVHPMAGDTPALIFQSVVMGALALVSLLITPKAVREENQFSWHPLVEVVVIFVGIFSAMIPALSLLGTHGKDLGVSEPWQYFVATGALSGFLDNAPTYLAFLSMSQHLPDEVAGTSHRVLQAISCGAVFFGAMTYIGNGPNFMVKAIAEHAGIRMPSFFGFLGWTLACLGPALVAVALIFFR